MWICGQNLMKFYVKRRVFGCINLVFIGSNLGLGVHALRDSNGAWCSDQSHLRSMVVDYYKDLFSSIGSTTSGYLHHGYFMQCTAKMRWVFTTPISDEEVSKTVFEMGPLRAPGVDGFNALFYQRNWSIVGSSVCALVRDTFNGHPFDASLNHTLFVLLPKVDDNGTTSPNTNRGCHWLEMRHTEGSPFLWLAASGRILTNAERTRRRMSDCSMCGVCGDMEESIYHLVRSCPSTLAIWLSIVQSEKLSEFLSMDFITCSTTLECGKRVVASIASVCRSYRRAIVLDRLELEWCKWWIVGSYRMRDVGVCPILETELLGVAEGLCLAWAAGVRATVLEVGNGDVARILQDSTRGNGLHGLVPTIRELLNRDWVVQVHHIRRSANMVVDGLAKMARDTYASSLRDVGLVTQVFFDTPDEVVSLVHADVSLTIGGG
ncbi:hypothetical protein GQ457_14G017610 [Hibiscus cannabinus]